MYKYIFIFLSINALTRCVNIGSDSAVKQFDNQVQVADGDRIAGFAALNGGLVFVEQNSGALFDSFFSVAGDIQLNWNTLNLNQDLIFQNVSDFISIGTINANRHNVHLAPSMDSLQSGGTTYQAQECELTFLDDATETFQVNEVDWSPDGAYLVLAIGEDGTGTNDKIRVYSFDGSTLAFVVGTDTDIGDDVYTVSWHPTNDWFAMGRDGDPGDELAIYSFDRILETLTKLDGVEIAGGGSNDDVQSVAWHPDGDHLAIGTDVDAVRVRVYEVDGSGMFGSFVTVTPTFDVNSVAWNHDGTSLAVGTDAGTGSELFVYTFDADALSLTLNGSINVGNQVNSVSWNTSTGETDLIAAGVNAGTGRVRVYRHDSSGSGSLTLLASAQAINSTIVNSVEWHPFLDCLAAGLNSNSEGSGGEIRLYEFASDAITEVDSESLGANALGVRWSRDGAYFASGSGTGATTPRLTAYSTDTVTVNASDVIFSNINLFLHDNIIFKDCNITFTGNNLLNGNDNCISLMDTCTLQIGVDSSLLLQNVRIQDICDDRIVLLDSTSTVSFKNVRWVMQQDYTFDTGRFDVIQGFNLEGKDRIFIYTSDQKSRILERGHMLIDSDVTFSYAPANNSNALLEFTHHSSTLSLNSGTIFASDAGLQLLKGMLCIDGKSIFINSGTQKSEGIVWGDGSNADNNLTVEWKPAAHLDVLAGFFTNDNV